MCLAIVFNSEQQQSISVDMPVYTPNILQPTSFQSLVYNQALVCVQPKYIPPGEIISTPCLISKFGGGSQDLRDLAHLT